jgi:adenylate cyclase
VRSRLSARQFARLRRNLIGLSLLVIVPVTAGVSVYDALWQTVIRVSRLHQVVFNLVQSMVVLVIIVIGSDIVLYLWLHRHARWAVGDGEPDDADRQDLIRLPVRAALTILGVVLLSTVIITVVSIGTGTAAISAIGTGFAFFLTGFTFALIVYLQAERALRPLFAMALTGGTVPDRRLTGVRARLVVTWLLAAAGPLLFILVIPLRSGHGDRLPIQVPMIYMAVAGLLLGGAATLLVAQSVAGPITEVRRSLQHVEHGELDIEVPVTYPGDLGQLQAGFNSMVQGLRERRTLEDLFGRHVGADVARQALTQEVELGGEVRSVTALFVDLIGSTSLAETTPAKQVVARINQLFGVVFDVVTETGGWINKFEGDGCLCIFGAPMALDDHPAHGLRAARTLGARLAAQGFEVGVGVACGEVVAGNVGSIERFEYTVIGRPINEAARLTDAAKLTPAHVLASENAVSRAGAEAEHWEAAGELELRGVSAPMAVARPRSD